MVVENNIDFYAENTMPAEVASELLNSARARIFARADTLAAVDRVAAQRLVGQAAELKRVQDTLSAAAPDRSHQVIGKWGPLLRDERAFWSELMEPVAA